MITAKIKWTAFIIIFFVTMLKPSTQVNTLIGEYHFYGQSSTTTVFNSVNNSTAQNSFYTPVGLHGSGYTSYEPTIVKNGVLIEKGKYLESNAAFKNSVNNSIHQTQLYMYYISGNPGEIFNMDYNYTTKYTSIKLYTSFVSGGYRVNINIPGNSVDRAIPQNLVVGWNLILVRNDCNIFDNSYNI